MWQEASRIRRNGIRNDVWFTIPEYDYQGNLLVPAKEKCITTWGWTRFRVQREHIPARTLGIPRVDNDPILVEPRTIWNFKIEWGDTWP